MDLLNQNPQINEVPSESQTHWLSTLSEDFRNFGVLMAILLIASFPFLPTLSHSCLSLLYPWPVTCESTEQKPLTWAYGFLGTWRWFVNPLGIYIVGHDYTYLAFLSHSKLWNHKCHILWMPVVSKNHYAYQKKSRRKKQQILFKNNQLTSE